MKKDLKKRFMRIGERIRGVREFNRQSREELSKISGFSVGQIRQWEIGKTGDMQMSELARLAKALNVPYHFFLREAEEGVSAEMEVVAAFMEKMPENTKEILICGLEESETGQSDSSAVFRRMLEEQQRYYKADDRGNE